MPGARRRMFIPIITDDVAGGPGAEGRPDRLEVLDDGPRRLQRRQGQPEPQARRVSLTSATSASSSTSARAVCSPTRPSARPSPTASEGATVVAATEGQGSRSMPTSRPPRGRTTPRCRSSPRTSPTASRSSRAPAGPRAATASTRRTARSSRPPCSCAPGRPDRIKFMQLAKGPAQPNCGFKMTSRKPTSDGPVADAPAAYPAGQVRRHQAVRRVLRWLGLGLRPRSVRHLALQPVHHHRSTRTTNNYIGYNNPERDKLIEDGRASSTRPSEPRSTRSSSDRRRGAPYLFAWSDQRTRGSCDQTNGASLDGGQHEAPTWFYQAEKIDEGGPVAVRSAQRTLRGAQGPVLL